MAGFGVAAGRDIMIKIAFFDVDGTLVTSDNRVLESTERALASLRAHGVRTVLATGRAEYEMPACVKLDDFDSLVMLNGQLCYDERGVYRSAPIPAADVAAVVDAVRAGKFEVLVLQGDCCYVSRTQRTIDVEEKIHVRYREGDIARALEHPVYQFCAYVDEAHEHMVTDVAHAVRTTRWTQLFCDVIPKEGGKGPGIAATLERYGLSASEAIAFGDGENDLSMFELCGESVAMGNAWDQVKERATYVTDSCDEDGIWNACAHFGLV